MHQDQPIDQSKDIYQPNMAKQGQIKPKQSLCRFYVRGLCNFPAQKCLFSHGIADLNYQPWSEGEPVQYDYLQDTVFCQKKANKGPRIYINLYEFQPDKKYTLQQLNHDRPLRTEVRAQMHNQMFHDFIQLLQNRFAGANLTEEILMREYTRVGFNKLMTRIKFSHLTGYLCEGEKPKYYLRSVLMPPLVKRQQNFIFRRAGQEEIVGCYRQGYRDIVKREGDLQQAVLKKMLFQMDCPDWSIPPLNLILKEKKVSFTDFLKVLVGEQLWELSGKVKFEPTVQELAEGGREWLEEQVNVAGWGQVFGNISKKFKINNGNLINQVKPHLILKGYRLFYFPMVQFIYPCKGYSFSKAALSLCKCTYKDKFDLSDYLQDFKHNQNELTEGESVDINDLSSSFRYAGHILNSKVLGVDLQGRLRKGGYVEMLQLNNTRNTFLIDFYQLQRNSDVKAVELIRKIVRNVFVDQQILKFFHDCRHDSLGLHEFLDTCIVNIFDTSAVETLRGQIQAYDSIDINHPQALRKAKTVVGECTNVRSVGLNDIYKRYKASHGVNRHKQRFHKMWGEGEQKFFLQRPMDPDYRDYCIRDVLDLPEVGEAMRKGMGEEMEEVGKWVSAQYVAAGFEGSSQGGKKQ